MCVPCLRRRLRRAGFEVTSARAEVGQCDGQLSVLRLQLD